MVDNNGIVDIILFVINLELVVSGNDVMLILSGIIDLLEGVIIILVVIDVGGNV